MADSTTNHNQLESTVFQLVAVDSLVIAARSDGLFLSENGTTWQNLFDALGAREPIPTVAVALPPEFKRDGRIFAGLAGGLLRTLDGGRSWENIQLPPPPPVVSSICFSPDYVRDGVIFAATLEDGVLFSSDRGSRWVVWNFGLLDLNVYCLAISPNFAEDETLFVGTQSGVFRSTNGGRAWREVELPIGFESVLSLAISLNFQQDGILYAGTEGRGMLYSEDVGQSWVCLSNGGEQDPINLILVAADDPRYLLALHNGQLRVSHDGGVSWSPWRNEQLDDNDVTAVCAPDGFEDGAQVWVGLADGRVLSLG